MEDDSDPPRSIYEWIHQRFQEFKSVYQYNSAMHRITSLMKLCGRMDISNPPTTSDPMDISDPPTTSDPLDISRQHFLSLLKRVTKSMDLIRSL